MLIWLDVPSIGVNLPAPSCILTAGQTQTMSLQAVNGTSPDAKSCPTMQSSRAAAALLARKACALE